MLPSFSRLVLPFARVPPARVSSPDRLDRFGLQGLFEPLDRRVHYARDVLL